LDIRTRCQTKLNIERSSSFTVDRPHDRSLHLALGICLSLARRYSDRSFASPVAPPIANIGVTRAKLAWIRLFLAAVAHFMDSLRGIFSV
jgi:hypothetical protein